MRKDIKIIPEGMEYAGWYICGVYCNDCKAQLRDIISLQKPAENSPDYCRECYSKEKVLDFIKNNGAKHEPT